MKLKVRYESDRCMIIVESKPWLLLLFFFSGLITLLEASEAELLLEQEACILLTYVLYNISGD